MKQLSIEQKAKLYDEALARAKEVNDEHKAQPFDVMTKVFPELKENEDEMIRKECISIIDAWDKSCRLQGDYCEVAPKCIAWLEKQGDKDKLIKELGEYKVKYTQDVLEKHLNCMNNKEEERLRKTTIAFLKDFAEQGYENAVQCIDWLEKQKAVDILDEEEREFADNVDSYRKEVDAAYQKGYNEGVKATLEKQGAQKPTEEYNITGIGSKHTQGKLAEMIKNLKPINEVLEQKPAWNEEDKKTLQTIINDLSEELDEETDKEEQEILSGKISFLQSLKPRPIHKWSREDNRTRLEITDFLEYQKMEEPTRVDILNKWIAWIANLEPQWKQKSAWSGEDETTKNTLINLVEMFYGACIDKSEKNRLLSWLKSLKDRVQPQQRQDWKQENIEELSDFENAMMHIGGSFFGENAGLDPNNTACIKEQANLLLELIPKQEWSEDDEKMIQDIINDIAIAQEQVYCKSRCEDEINWLKSLRPHGRWKPNEGQLECLGYAIEKVEKDWSPLTNNRIYLTLKELKKQLENL